ncbi:MAG: hypothetical protein HeimC2_02270 [Candidatus Heimdallarchaeota archaeon LC_2]|nr:MAG: hypothetical protein HeimC2_02270 [Candidatus Heimdallarchaeota archaeon LC_2]
MLITIFGSTNSVSGAVVWFEDFNDNNLDDWELYGWDSSATGLNVDIDHGFTIVDGALKGPSSTIFSTQSNLDINSTVAKGTWSFDLKIDEIEDTHFGVAFMYTILDGKYNLSGETPVPDDWTGYGLVFLTYERNDNLIGPGMNMVAFDPSLFQGQQIIKKYAMPKANLTGSHHIDITRNLLGEMKIYFDFELKFSESDTRSNSSEKVRVTSWMGGAAIDNIRVSDTVEIPTKPTSDTASTHETSTTPTSTTSESLTSSSSETSSTEDNSPIRLLYWFSPVLLIIINRRVQIFKNNNN